MAVRHVQSGVVVFAFLPMGVPFARVPRAICEGSLKLASIA